MANVKFWQFASTDDRCKPPSSLRGARDQNLKGTIDGERGGSMKKAEYRLVGLHRVSNNACGNKENSSRQLLAYGAPDERLCISTPSAPHKQPQERNSEPSTPKTPTWASDSIRVIPHSRTEARLSIEQQGALFAQFSLPVANFQVLSFIAQDVIQLKQESKNSTPASKTQEFLARSTPMEDLIPPC